MFKQLTAAVALTALASLPAMAAPVKMTDARLDMVVAGGDYCPPPETKTKGNNGWGNGADGTNPGSFKGKTAPSKSNNSSMPGAGKVNTNPTNSDGR